MGRPSSGPDQPCCINSLRILRTEHRVRIFLLEQCHSIHCLCILRHGRHAIQRCICLFKTNTHFHLSTHPGLWTMDAWTIEHPIHRVVHPTHSWQPTLHSRTNTSQLRSQIQYADPCCLILGRVVDHRHHLSTLDMSCRSWHLTASLEGVGSMQLSARHIRDLVIIEVGPWVVEYRTFG